MSYTLVSGNSARLVCAESDKGSLCFFESTLSNEVVGRFRCEEYTDQDRNRPDPLETEGKTVGPLETRRINQRSKLKNEKREVKTNLVVDIHC